MMFWLRNLFAWRDPYFASYERALARLEKDSRKLEERITKRKEKRDRFHRAATVYMAMLMLPLLLMAVHAAKSPQSAFTKEERAMRIAPAIVFPGILLLLRSLLASAYAWRESSDTRYLRKLRGKQRAMIDELKDRSAYEKMQALIQRYDPTVLPASASAVPRPTGAAGAATPGSAAAAGMRQRKGGPVTPAGPAPKTPVTPAAGLAGAGSATPTTGGGAVAATTPGSTMQKMRPFADALAAHLVGEKPDTCIALVCEKCHAHNGLARPEDYGNMKVYYCPKCNHLNGVVAKKEEAPPPAKDEGSSAEKGGEGASEADSQKGAAEKKEE